MSASEQGGRIDKEIFTMTKADSREIALAPRKEVSGTKATSTSSGLGLRTWLGLKDPRIVRVSRSFGGKDRHSKVSTVKGLRDRRVRLSVQTAIQLYDLQDRLGLSQPSKVVDWLLNATQHEIDKLPPLQMPPAGNFSSCSTTAPFSHSSISMELARPGRRETDPYSLELTANNSSNRAKGINMSSTGKTARGLTFSSNANETRRSSSNKSDIHTTGHDHVISSRKNMEGQQQCDDAEAAQRGVLLTGNTSFPSNAAGMYATYFHLEPPNAEPSGAVACSLIPSQAEPNSGYHRPVPLLPPAASLSLMPGPQLMLCPSGTSTSMASIFQSNYATAPVDYDAKHINLSTHMISPPASQNFFSNSLFASFPSYVPK